MVDGDESWEHGNRAKLQVRGAPAWRYRNKERQPDYPFENKFGCGAFLCISTLDPPDPDRSIFQVWATDNFISSMTYLGDGKRRNALVWAKTVHISIKHKIHKKNSRAGVLK